MNLDALSQRPPTCRRPFRLLLLLAIAWSIGSASATTTAATLTEQRRSLSRAGTLLSAAERLARAGRSDDARAAYEEAAQVLSALAQELNPRLERTFDRAMETAEQTHAKLTAAGLSLPPFQRLVASSSEPTLGQRRNNERDAVSFVDHIVPVLLDKCGKCHVSGRKGGLSMASYDDLMRGGRSGGVVKQGSGIDSLLVQLIAAGEMPPSGDPVSPQAARELVLWINQGAKFDGDDPAKPLAELTKVAGKVAEQPPPQQPAAPAPNIAMADGDETVSFALHIAPILTASCLGCHGADRPGAGLSMADFRRLWQGGDSGPAIVPGDPDRSLLVQKLRGTAAEGRRMPLNRPPLADDQIELFAQWITEGAKFDGPGVELPLARVAAVVRAERSTGEELSAERAELAAEQWRLAIPDEQATQVLSERFLVVGNLPRSQLELLAKQAETEAGRVLQYFRTPGEPLNKGRITLFAFAKRIDYSEFGTMVEQRQLPTELVGHARYDVLEPYAAMTVDADDADTNGRILAMVIAELVIADRTQGRAPSWFTRGSGRAAVAKLWPADDQVKQWRQELPAAVASLRSAEPFFAGQLPPATGDLVAFGFVEGILKKPGNFDRLVSELASGNSFDEACQAVYRRSAEDLLALWVASTRGRR